MVKVNGAGHIYATLGKMVSGLLVWITLLVTWVVLVLEEQKRAVRLT